MDTPSGALPPPLFRDPCILSATVSRAISHRASSPPTARQLHCYSRIKLNDVCLASGKGVVIAVNPLLDRDTS